MSIETKEIITFLFVLMRVSMILLFLPFFGSKLTPMQFRIGLILAVSLVITPVVNIGFDGNDIAMILLREMIFSFVIALTVRFLFYAIDAGGQIMSTTMGLSIATVFNPEIGQSTELTRLYSLIAMLLFLSLNGHHYFIYAVVSSFHYIPVGGADIKELVRAGIMLSGRIFEIALKIAAPIIAVVMITNILLGVLYKLIPQFNIFFVAYPLYISLGYVVLILGIPFFFIFFGNYIFDMRNYFNNLILIGGR